jgi:hypothetical protein
MRGIKQKGRIGGKRKDILYTEDNWEKNCKQKKRKRRKTCKEIENEKIKKAKQSW